MTHKRAFCGAILGLLLGLPQAVQAAEFSTGPIFTEFGPSASIDTTIPLPAEASFKIAFDTAKQAKEGNINRTLESAARFINMHARSGVALEDMDLAVVIHGKAVFDVSLSVGADPHANVSVVKALTEKGVRIIVCGQSAAYHGVATGDLLPGVEMQLSAMTAHALLQQDGYTLNPF